MYLTNSGTMSVIKVIQHFITNPLVMGIWVALVTLSLGILVWDLRTNNEALGSLMKYVWDSLCFTQVLLTLPSIGIQGGPRFPTTRFGAEAFGRYVIATPGVARERLRAWLLPSGYSRLETSGSPHLRSHSRMLPDML